MFLAFMHTDYLRFCLQSDILSPGVISSANSSKPNEASNFLLWPFSLCLSHQIQFAFRVFVVRVGRSLSSASARPILSQSPTESLSSLGLWVFLFFFFP